MKLLDAVCHFIEFYCSDRPPLLLALSGGPDSMALFHILLEVGYPFEVAHINHGWRKESASESQFLSQMCLKKGIPFFQKKLTPQEGEKNLEEKGREARLAFFKTVLESRNLKGVLLAHHADDHAETVLKRIFEGASLPKLKGLMPKVEVKGLWIYRPFLEIKKKEIVSWLREKKIEYFLDPTNRDPRFLRSRLREELIPSISTHFGKEITSNLCRLGEAAAELDQFLAELISPYLHQVEIVSEGVALDFKKPPGSVFLWKMVLRAFFDSQKLSVSRPFLETILLHLQKESCHKSLRMGKQEILIHKRRITIKHRNQLMKKAQCSMIKR